MLFESHPSIFTTYYFTEKIGKNIWSKKIREHKTVWYCLAIYYTSFLKVRLFEFRFKT